MELFVAHNIKLVTKFVYSSIFIFFLRRDVAGQRFSRQQTARPASNLFVLVPFWVSRLDWQGQNVLSGDPQLYQKPRKACLGPSRTHWPWTVLFRSSETPSRHFQPEWQTLILVVKKWIQHLKDLLPCWLPLRCTRWQLAKISRLSLLLLEIIMLSFVSISFSNLSSKECWRFQALWNINWQFSPKNQASRIELGQLASSVYHLKMICQISIVVSPRCRDQLQTVVWLRVMSFRMSGALPTTMQYNWFFSIHL